MGKPNLGFLFLAAWVLIAEASARRQASKMPAAFAAEAHQRQFCVLKSI